MCGKLVLGALLAPFIALDLLSNLGLLNSGHFNQMKGLWEATRVLAHQNPTWSMLAAFGLFALVGALAAVKGRPATQK